MRIVHLSSEFAPIAKAGGLGEVLVGLSRELTKKGHEVETVIPKYDLIKPSELENLKLEISNFDVLGYKNAAWSAKAEDCSLHFLDAHHPSRYFSRKKIYGCKDDISRFLYFSCMALEYLSIRNEPIDILHLHDWHVSFCAPMVKDFFKNLKIKAIVLSIHNVEYQGKCGVKDLEEIGLDAASYLSPDKLQDNDPKHPKSINLLKAGIVYSDAIVPVSPSYAKEILTPEYGFGLDPTLEKEKHKIRGILNGIDTKLWDPERDCHLDLHYGCESVYKAKKFYRDKFCLPQENRPWVGAVTRLVPQKGPELLEAALKRTVELGGTFLLLGSSPIPEIQKQFDRLQKEYVTHPQVLLHYEYNEPLAHKIYACLDFLLVPSHFEPCGLTQLIAMRYGTVPIVRETGGLKDTIFDCENSKVPPEKRNGFLFKSFTPQALNQTLFRAFELFRNDPSSFKALIRRGMLSDFSWEKSGEEYARLYRSLLSRTLNSEPTTVNF